MSRKSFEISWFLYILSPSFPFLFMEISREDDLESVLEKRLHAAWEYDGSTFDPTARADRIILDACERLDHEDALRVSPNFDSDMAASRRQDETLFRRNTAWLTRILDRYAPHLRDFADLYAGRFSHELSDTADYGITPSDFDFGYKLVTVCSAEKFEHPPVAFEDADVRIEDAQGLRAWLFPEEQLVAAGIDKSMFAEEKNEHGKLPVVVVVNGLSSRDFSLLQKIRLFWQQQGYLALMVECKPYRREENGGRLYVHSFAERNEFLLHCVLERLRELPYVDMDRISFVTHSMGRSVVVDSWKRLIDGGVSPMGLFGIAPPTILSNTASAFSHDSIAFLIGAKDPLLEDCLAAMVSETLELSEGFVAGIVPPDKHGLAFHRGDLVAHMADFLPHAHHLGFVGQVGKPHPKNPFRTSSDLSFIGTSLEDILDEQRRDFQRYFVGNVVGRVPTFGFPRDRVRVEAREFLSRISRNMRGEHVIKIGDRTLSKRFVTTVMQAHNFDGDPEETNALLAMMWWFVNLYLVAKRA